MYGEEEDTSGGPKLNAVCRIGFYFGGLCHGAKHLVVPANARTVLLVGGLGVAHLVEFGLRGEQTASEPDGITLHVMRDDIDVDWFGLYIDRTMIYIYIEMFTSK